MAIVPGHMKGHPDFPQSRHKISSVIALFRSQGRPAPMPSSQPSQHPFPPPGAPRSLNLLGITRVGREFGPLKGTVRRHRASRSSKRGSHYLRRAIWQAAQVVAFGDSALKPCYEAKRREGRHHFTAVGAVAHKLVHIIYAMLRGNKPYVSAVRGIASWLHIAGLDRLLGPGNGHNQSSQQ